MTDKDKMGITSKQELILAYVSDYIHRNLETNFLMRNSIVGL